MTLQLSETLLWIEFVLLIIVSIGFIFICVRGEFIENDRDKWKEIAERERIERARLLLDLTDSYDVSDWIAEKLYEVSLDCECGKARGYGPKVEILRAAKRETSKESEL